MRPHVPMRPMRPLPLQALMPMAVFLVGVLFTTEKFTLPTGLTMLVVVAGTMAASHGACTGRAQGERARVQNYMRVEPGCKGIGVDRYRAN